MVPSSPKLECRLASASLAAYSIAWNPSTGMWSIPTGAPGYDKIGLAKAPVCFADGVNSINAGFVGETTDDWVFVVFRGTLPPFTGDFWAWIDDWLQDFDIGPVPWIVNGTQFGSVEGGFATALLALWPLAQAALSKINLQNKKGIIVSGHSKGAAMSFLAASLLKSTYPTLLVEDCCFAAPLTCDATFQANYNKLGLRPFTVRYQNENDIVPFLPWYPVFDLLAASERMSRADHRNRVVTASVRMRAIHNDYVPIGILRYITTNCDIEYGDKAERDAIEAIEWALLFFEYVTIAEAHSMAGRYDTCICS